MINRRNPFPRFSPVGDAALLLELGDRIRADTNRTVHALDAWLSQSPLKGVVGIIPAYVSLLILYDPLEVNYLAVKSWVEVRMETCPSGQVRTPRRVEIPVRYGGEDGPDLADVADYHGLPPEDVIRKHTALTYRVGMMGFTPGFAYLMGLDPALATPRLATPRTLVPAGSVGIAGVQTGIYPLDSPGGWRLIGRTESKLFDPQQDPPFLLSPGDEVCFVAEGTGVGR